MSENAPKINVHAHLRNMPPQTPEEFAKSLKEDEEDMDNNVRRVQQLLKEGKNPADEFPYWGH